MYSVPIRRHARRHRLRALGRRNLWYKIAEANGLTADKPAARRHELSSSPPACKANANNATTFKPYDPLEVLGSTTPTRRRAEEE